MKSKLAAQFIAACAISTGDATAFAHVTLQDGAAAANKNYRATLRVGHGCDGASITGIKVSVPAGFNGAQPMPMAGWTVSTVVAKLAQPHESPAALLEVLDIQPAGGHSH